MCSDTGDVLQFMEKEKIGTELIVLYEALSLTSEKSRNFVAAYEWLERAKLKQLAPASKLNQLIADLSDRMEQRIIRDYFDDNEENSAAKNVLQPSRPEFG